MKIGIRYNRRSGENAFTLVEVLIATIIFSLIIAAMNVTFYSAMRLESNTSLVVDPVISMNHAISVLRGDIKNILMTGGVLAGPIIGLAPGSGNSQSGQLQVYATTGRLDAGQPWGDIQKISYYLQDPTNSSSNVTGKDLIRETTRNLLASGTPDLWEQPLLNGVTFLEFSFFDGIEWSKSWDSTMQTLPMPQAIKVRIEFSSEDLSKPSRLPLEMVVPLDVQGFTNNISSTNINMMTGGVK